MTKNITWNGSVGSVANRHGLYRVVDNRMTYECWRDSNGGAIAIQRITIATSSYPDDLSAAAEKHAAERAAYPAPR